MTVSEAIHTMATQSAIAEDIGKVAWATNKHHNVIIDPSASRNDKLAAYAKWASTFEDDVLSYGLHSPATLTTMLFSYVPRNTTKLVVMDAGCGTGVVEPALRDSAEKAGIELFSVGADFSKEMLDEAERLGRYNATVVADLTQDEINGLALGSFDAITAAGVFRAGHCGPDFVQHVVKFGRKGCLIAATIRTLTYENESAEFDKAFADANCVELQREHLPYIGNQLAYYFIFRKVQ